MVVLPRPILWKLVLINFNHLLICLEAASLLFWKTRSLWFQGDGLFWDKGIKPWQEQNITRLQIDGPRTQR